MRHGKAQALKNNLGGSGRAKALHADHRAVQPHILAPVIRSGGLNGYAGAHAAWQHALLVGRVLRVKNFGVFVELIELQVQGLVHMSALSHEFVRYDSQRQVLRTGRAVIARGTRLRVAVHRVNVDERQIDFVPVPPGPGAAAPRRRRGR